MGRPKLRNKPQKTERHDSDVGGLPLGRPRNKPQEAKRGDSDLGGVLLGRPKPRNKPPEAKRSDYDVGRLACDGPGLEASRRKLK